MKRLLGTLTAVAICLAIVGYFMGWFAVSTSKRVDGKSDVTLTVDQDEIRRDKEKALEKLQDVRGDQPK